MEVCCIITPKPANLKFKCGTRDNSVTPQTLQNPLIYTVYDSRYNVKTLERRARYAHNTCICDILLLLLLLLLLLFYCTKSIKPRIQLYTKGAAKMRSF